jgi:acetylglutamate kinase
MLLTEREVERMETVVLKVGGSILKKLPKSFFDMVVHLKETMNVQPVIVHGGGPEINTALEKMNVKTEFVDGLRVTSKEVLYVVENILSGNVNKLIVRRVQQSGGTGIGLSGVDMSLIQVSPKDPSGKLGFVGKVEKVNTDWLHLLMKNGAIPVISPIGLHPSGDHYNINGDVAAAAVASSLQAKLVMISDIPGVLEEVEGVKKLHTELSEKQIEKMIADGVIYGGMIPKVSSTLEALGGGVKEAVILNGLVPGDLKAYLEGEQVGTKIIKEEVHHV